MTALKLIPHLVAWTLMVLLLLRGFPGRGRGVTLWAVAGFAVGTAGYVLLSRMLPVKIPLEIIRATVGVSFFLLWVVSVGALYRSTVRDFPLFGVQRLMASPFAAWLSAVATGLVAGGICASRLPGLDGAAAQLLAPLLLALTGALLVLAARGAERRLTSSLTIPPSSLLGALVALLLFSSSSILLLDLFSPLSMKVMKGIHDFVHQFMESILIPDHLFIRPPIWRAIGLLFGKEVGFWGGLVIWFTPALLLLLAIQLEPLPSVAQIRQGAQRRMVQAAAIRTKRYRLVIPLLALAILGMAVYQSSFPNVEYWDPKPLTITASPGGELFIPRKGEVPLDDGKLHKYLYKGGGKEVRFFVLTSPDGKLTVDLDACAICKPDGYGQAEGMVICYYCKTLIPLETVGKPGGCNPVPVPFTEREDGVHLDAVTLVNSWSQTVQATTRTGKEMGK